MLDRELDDEISSLVSKSDKEVLQAQFTLAKTSDIEESEEDIPIW